MRSHRENLSRGFTLVELLVVITIIGLLAALIVPAVQGAIETARRNTCTNNLSQVGLGAYNFATSKGYFPGYLNKLGSNNVSWQIALLNNMGRENIYSDWVAGTVNAPYLEMYVCPSDNTAIGLQGPFTSYAVNAGKTGNQNNGNDTWEGICHNLSYSNTTEQANAKTRRVTLDGIPDGADMTILAVENVDANKYYDTAMPADAEDLLGVIWSTTAGSPLQANKSTGKRTNMTGADAQYARPSSNHSGVFNVVFAGRNTKTLDENIDQTLWQYLMTPNGKKLSQTDNTVLNKDF
jgi:prepilin-type N-terminal cleavage/methylation domain-containing protein